jgi:DUF971 family protein
VTSAHPAIIRRHGTESVEIRWQDGHRSVYPNRYLRDHCPCAGCRERPVRALPVRGGAGVHPEHISLVGRYAINIQWSDRHADGLYSYETLRSLCPCAACDRSGGVTER